MASQFSKEGLSSNADGDNTRSGIHKNPNDASEASKADSLAAKSEQAEESHEAEDSDSDGLEDISAVSQGSSQGSAASEASFRDYDDDESTLGSGEESDVRATDEEEDTDDLNDESESEEEEDEKSEDDEVETADEEEASSSEASEDNLVLDDKQFQSRLTSGSDNSLSLDIKSVPSRQTPMDAVEGGKEEAEPSAASSDCDDPNEEMIDEAKLKHARCYFCNDDITNRVVLAGCKHVFCKECLIHWIKEKKDCPICESPFNDVLVKSAKSRKDLHPWTRLPVGDLIRQ